ncbi:MAG: DUF4031 domain-containing protein [Bacteroidota bacterium]
MIVYIDPPHPRTGHSHMTASTIHELHKFARENGLPKEKYHAKKYRFHYDVPANQYQKMVDAGAIPVSRKQIITVMKQFFDLRITKDMKGCKPRYARATSYIARFRKIYETPYIKRKAKFGNSWANEINNLQWELKTYYPGQYNLAELRRIQQKNAPKTLDDLIRTG